MLTLQNTLVQTLHRQLTHTSRRHFKNMSTLPRAKSFFCGAPTRWTQYRSLRTTNTTKSNKTPYSPIDQYLWEGPIPRKNVIKSVLFTGGFTLACFAGASIAEYERTRSIINNMKKARNDWIRFGAPLAMTPADKLSELKMELKRLWNALSPGERVFIPICALNLLVFGLWRLPAMRQSMMTYFINNPAARIVCWPMLLSTFSHYSAFHIFANMYVLHSFSNPIVMSLGKEQFYGFYLASGVIASLTSTLYKAAVAKGGLSLGASGAIMAVVSFICTQYPDTQLSILFIPGFVFSASKAIVVIMGFDFAGCLLGWKFFDHAAHIGGALCGMFWAKYGAEVWSTRTTILSYYRDLRRRIS